MRAHARTKGRGGAEVNRTTGDRRLPVRKGCA
jgi:hypothetical protein